MRPTWPPDGMVHYILHEAIQEYGTDIRIGSLGALSKGTLDSEGDPVVCILHDGMRDAEVNNQIRVLDQDNTPTTADIKRVLKAKNESQLKFMGHHMVVDVQGAQSAWSGTLARLSLPGVPSSRQHRHLH